MMIKHPAQCPLVIAPYAGYIDKEAWQIAEIHKAIGEANAGGFAADDEISAVKNKWGVHAG